MWTVMWVNEEYGRIDFMTGFKTREETEKYVKNTFFLPEEYATIAEIK